MNSNPLAEHNAGIALSSKQIPVGGGGTGNMYQGQAGRAFVQGGGGMSQFHSFDGGNADSAYARGSYAPVTVGYNSVTRGGSRKRTNKSKRKLRKTGRRNKKRGCDIVTGFGGSRRYRRCRRCRCCKSSCRCSRKQRSQRKSQSGGGWGAPYGSSAASGINAGYSIGGPGTGVTPSTIALANPAAPTAYNSCHPV
jgi:hypothetical protein